MRAIHCDLCGEVINGEYKKVKSESTNPFFMVSNSQDVCMKCWNVITNTVRIPLVEFPNKED